MNIIKVKYIINADNELSSREYTYFSEDPLQVGDVVTIPVRDTTCKAKVSAVDVPETEIEAFKDKVKTIPAKTEPEFGTNDLPPMAPTTAANANSEPRELKLELAGDVYMMAGKATIKVQPESDTVILSLLAEANQLRDYAIARVIKSDNDMELAVNDLSIIANVRKALTAKKAEYYKPIKAHLDAVSAAFQTLLTPIEDADRITRDKWTAYWNEQARRKAEADAINREAEALAKRQAEFSGTGEITVDLKPMDAPIPVARIQTDMGSVGVMRVRKWEVEDLSKVPIDYLMIDATKVGKVVRAGIPAIQGIRIWEEESLRVTAK